MSQDFIFDFLPSFYKERMVNADGVNVLTPIFEEYAKYAADLLAQAQQISLGRSLELCPAYIKENFKTIDVRVDSRNPKSTAIQFPIDSSTIGFDTLFYDAAFTKPVSVPYTIVRDLVADTAFVQFDAPLESGYNTLFSRFAYWNPHLLRDLYGKLANYTSAAYNYTSLSAFTDSVEAYRRRLLGIFYGLRHASTVPNMETALGLFLGLKYAPVSGVVSSVSSKNLSIQGPDGKVVSVASVSKINVTKYPVGTVVNKYDILEEMPFLIYDIFSNPARFTQYLLCEKGALLLWLLRVDTTNNEKYAYLSYDSGLNYDDGLFWDMGDNTGVDHTPINVVDYPRPATELQHRFDGYSDARWDSGKLYEMFRNVFIIELGDSTINRDLVSYFINRIKPVHTGCIVGAVASVAILDDSPGRTPTIFEH